MKVQIRSLPLAVGALLLGAITAQAQTTTRVSVATGGVQANGESPYSGAKLSANGRFVAFRSVATNLVGAGNDTNGFSDIFVHDRATGITTRVSVATGGAQAVGGNSNNPSISADGRYVSFSSNATNLAAGDTNGANDAFVHDRVLGTTTLVSADATGAPGNGLSDSSAISGDGNMIAFRSLATNLTGSPTAGSQIFVRNVALGTTTLVSVGATGLGSYGNGESGLAQVTISANGNVVGFSSVASNLVASDTNGIVRDVFVRNLALGSTTLVSKSTSGLQGMSTSYSSALSADGRYVAFASRNNFVNGDNNNLEDVFVRDTFTNTTIRASVVDSTGAQGNGASGYSEGWGISISANGMRVAFQSRANNLVTKASNGFTDNNNLEDVFLRDISTGKTYMVSKGIVAGKPGSANGSSGGLSTCGVSISADGQTVMFASYASNLVAGDTNNVMDVFVRGLIL
ncbi:hypothetical protein [Armatimonas sp.]|uniref:hypothetical protein n=1 Tax=Armatimonas sp. TaxID=1872638 RepID=UPI00286BC858|nr:hypothetical protein [Armatimonas sp.]